MEDGLTSVCSALSSFFFSASLALAAFADFALSARSFLDPAPASCQELTLIHLSAQRKHLLRATPGDFSGPVTKNVSG